MRETDPRIKRAPVSVSRAIHPGYDLQTEQAVAETGNTVCTRGMFCGSTRPSAPRCTNAEAIGPGSQVNMPTVPPTDSIRRRVVVVCAILEARWMYIARAVSNRKTAWKILCRVRQPIGICARSLQKLAERSGKVKRQTESWKSSLLERLFDGKVAAGVVGGRSSYHWEMRC